ncbi:MAG: hypothetical protein PF541_05405 [Prolixibacteraceae bacterium]|jgi:hypothetical protein|nr:hypothetical protein [Prolixibacteraceae bacterium]
MNLKNTNIKIIDMEDILIPIAFFAVTFGIVYIIVSARNKERMALITSGADPSLFKSKFKFNQYNIFKWGLFLVGIAAGIIVANLFSEANAMKEEVAYPSMILLFGGLSLIVSYLLRNKLNKED